MKKLLFVGTVIAVIVLAIGASAHGPASWGDVKVGEGMMRYIEDKAIGSADTHEEMEELMEKMIGGTLTEEEAGKMVEFMRGNAGSFGMMLARQNSNEGKIGKNKNTGDWGMMGSWGGGNSWWNFSWFFLIHIVSFILVWTFLGMGTLAFWKWVEKK